MIDPQGQANKVLRSITILVLARTKLVIINRSTRLDGGSGAHTCTTHSLSRGTVLFAGVCVIVFSLAQWVSGIQNKPATRLATGDGGSKRKTEAAVPEKDKKDCKETSQVKLRQNLHLPFASPRDYYAVDPKPGEK